MNYIFRLLDATNLTNSTNITDLTEQLVATEEGNSKCEMFGGFGVLIQAILGAAAFSTVFYVVIGFMLLTGTGFYFCYYESYVNVGSGLRFFNIK